MALRKIALMHVTFGRSDGKVCGTCRNFVRGLYRSKTLQKCEAYGLTHSEASDWAQSWPACGLYDRVWTGVKIMNLVRPNRKDSTEKEEGQMDMWSADKQADTVIDVAKAEGEKT